MSAVRLAILIALAVCASIRVAHADARPRVAVLGLEVSGTADPRSTAVAHELTEGMRARARIGNGPYAYAPSSERELIDEKVINMCDFEAPACMSTIAKGVGADVLVYGKLDKQGANYRVSLHLLDATKKKKLNRLSVTIPLKATSEVTRAAAKKAYDDLAGEIAPSGGTIEIVANVEDGTIYVDDTQTEALRDGKATLQLPEGRYVIAVEADGHQRKEIRVTLKSNETIEQTFDLAAATRGDAVVTTRREPPGSTEKFWKYGFYGTVAVGSLVTAWTLIDFARWRLAASDITASRSDDPSTSGVDESQPGTLFTGDDCNGGALGPRVTSDPNGTLEHVCALKNRQFTTAVVAVVLGAVAVGTGVGWYVTHDRAKRTERMSFAPSLSPQGASATFELRW